MELPQLPYEILLHISAYSCCGKKYCRSGSPPFGLEPCGGGSNSLLLQLILHRPFYDYYVENRQYILQLHIKTITSSMRHVTRTLFGRLHAYAEPALIRADGMQYWFQHDRLHRLDGPATIYPDGTQVWYRNGKRHREDGPAIVYLDDTQWWCFDEEYRWYLNDEVWYNH